MLRLLDRQVLKVQQAQPVLMALKVLQVMELQAQWF
jgi:hypothetical protein